MVQALHLALQLRPLSRHRALASRASPCSFAWVVERKPGLAEEWEGYLRSVPTLLTAAVAAQLAVAPLTLYLVHYR